MISDASLKDSVVIADIEKECFSLPWSKNAIEKAIKDPSYTVLCKYCDGEVCAYITALNTPDSVDICNIAVREEFRRRGFASELLRELIRRFENKKVFLEVRSKNTAAISLYEKMGFCFAGKRKSFYSNPTDDAFILTLDAKVGTN